MKRTILATACTLAAAVTAAPAGAHPTYHYTGGCALQSVKQATVTGDRWEGVVYALVVATDDRSIPFVGVAITVECELRVGDQEGTVVLRASGTTVAAGAAQVSYVAADGDVVELCETVVVGGENHGTLCHELA